MSNLAYIIIDLDTSNVVESGMVVDLMDAIEEAVVIAVYEDMPSDEAMGRIRLLLGMEAE